MNKLKILRIQFKKFFKYLKYAKTDYYSSCFLSGFLNYKTKCTKKISPTQGALYASNNPLLNCVNKGLFEVRVHCVINVRSIVNLVNNGGGIFFLLPFRRGYAAVLC